MAPLTPEERKRLKSRISAALCNLGCVFFYYAPASRRIIARSLTRSSRWTPPPDGLLVGLYRAPIASHYVLGDLDDLLARPPGLPATPPLIEQQTTTVAGKRRPDVPDLPPLPDTWWSRTRRPPLPE